MEKIDQNALAQRLFGSSCVLDEGIIILQINDTRHNKQYTQS